ncbi:MAG TPA: NADH-quinone oxidoreductase subunit C [Myxococcales bacterium]|jgi:NADH-quinone oxidoreductase subunit C
MKAALERLKARFPDAVTEVYSSPRGDDYVVVKAEALREVARFCKDDAELDLKMFLSVCVVDRLLLPNNDPRFEVVYQVRQGREPFKKLHLKAFVTEAAPELPSLQPVWKGADWWERYSWDFYGIRFTGHPNLRRVLLYEEFQGHPLRKDYPMKARQPLVAERDFVDKIRGPGAASPAK